MNITSYNVTDVGYHYIGLRALDSLASRHPQRYADIDNLTERAQVRDR